MMKYILFLLVLIFSNSVQAEEGTFSPQNANVTISVKYAALGKYTATFEKYQGNLDYDVKEGLVKSVFLKIEVGTIKSGFSFNDGIVRSPQLLDSKRFPFITFQSKEILKTENGYMVKGVLELHGVRKEISFPFSTQLVKDPTGENVLKFSGKWVVARKEFGIIWNKFLDQGGVLVGNHITVDWEINMPVQ